MSKQDGTAQTTPMPPQGLTTLTCRCGARYLDTVGGREAHVTVFGHEPRKESA